MDIQGPKTNSLPLKPGCLRDNSLSVGFRPIFMDFLAAGGPPMSKYPSFPSRFSGKLRGAVEEILPPRTHKALGPLKPDPWDFTDRFSIQHLGKVWGLIFLVPFQEGQKCWLKHHHEILIMTMILNIYYEGETFALWNDEGRSF